jgi:hypothetical protein
MNIKDVTEFINNNKTLLDNLKTDASDVISDVKTLELIKTSSEQASKFVDALSGKIVIENGQDRLSALNAAITGFENELSETDDTLQQMALNKRIAVLEQMRANVQVAAGFNEIIAFTDDEKTKIEDLLKKAETDINNRKKVKVAIDIVTSLIGLAARIAANASTFGIT